MEQHALHVASKRMDFRIHSTDYPISAEVGETVTRQVCANFGYIGDCCSWSEDILVKRCYDAVREVDFMVYRLAYPPGCPIAYCAGASIYLEGFEY